MTIDTFIKTINRLRRLHKDNWYTFTGLVNGNHVEIKGFGTWLQIFRINGVNHGSTMGLSVSQYNWLLNNPELTVTRNFKPAIEG